MDPFEWVKNVNAQPPEGPGDALARALSMFASLCEEATPNMPKNVTAEVFQFLRTDPEFGDIAAEVLSNARAYTGIESREKSMGLTKSSSTPRLEELPNITAAAFEHATEAIGMDAMKVIFNEVPGYLEMLNKGIKTIDTLADVLDSPIAYVLALVCGLGIFFDLSIEIANNGIRLGSQAATRRLRFRAMATGLLYFSGYYWTRVQTVFSTASDPANVRTVFDLDLAGWRNLANDRTQVLNPSAEEFLEIYLDYQTANPPEQQRLSTTVNKVFMLTNHYERHGETFPVWGGELGYEYLKRQKEMANSNIANGLATVFPAIAALQFTEKELEVDRLMEMLDLVIDDYESGNRRYEYWRNARGFLAYGLAVAIVMSAGGYGWSIDDVIPRGMLHRTLLKMKSALMKIGPSYHRNDPVYQGHIDTIAQMIVNMAQAGFWDNKVFDELSEGQGQLINLMTELIDIRKSANKNTNKGDVVGADANRLMDMETDLRNARARYNNVNPNNQINASCAGGGSSVVDALFARVSL